MKSALVTGAVGFVGTALCHRLTSHGVKVTALVREGSDTEAISGLDDLEILYCDMSDYASLPERVGRKNFDVFFHLAWEGSAGSLRADANVQTDNIRYSCDAVKACAAMGCRRFVYAASIMEYEYEAALRAGKSQGVNSLYSIAKRTAGDMSRVLADSLGTEHIRAVISNIYGPGERSPRLINSSLRALLAGQHCSFSAGEQLYDFIYIDDAAEAFFAIAEKGYAGKTYYIGSESPKPLKEYLRCMSDQTGCGSIGLGEYPFNGVSLTYREFDTCALKADTGFVPLTSFDEGIRKTIKWIRETVI